MSPEWHLIRDPNSTELDELAVRYRLHPLHIEDCRHRNQSAKLEEAEDYLFFVFKPVVLEADGSLDTFDFDLFLGRDFLITVDEGGADRLGPVLERIRANWGTQRADQVMYRILDAVVDSSSDA